MAKRVYFTEAQLQAMTVAGKDGETGVDDVVKLYDLSVTGTKAEKIVAILEHQEKLQAKESNKQPEPAATNDKPANAAEKSEDDGKPTQNPLQARIQVLRRTRVDEYRDPNSKQPKLEVDAFIRSLPQEHRKATFGSFYCINTRDRFNDDRNWAIELVTAQLGAAAKVKKLGEKAEQGLRLTAASLTAAVRFLVESHDLNENGDVINVKTKIVFFPTAKMAYEGAKIGKTFKASFKNFFIDSAVLVALMEQKEEREKERAVEQEKRAAERKDKEAYLDRDVAWTIFTAHRADKTAVKELWRLLDVDQGGELKGSYKIQPEQKPHVIALINAAVADGTFFSINGKFELDVEKDHDAVFFVPRERKVGQNGFYRGQQRRPDNREDRDQQPVTNNAPQKAAVKGKKGKGDNRNNRQPRTGNFGSILDAALKANEDNGGQGGRAGTTSREKKTEDEVAKAA